MVRPKEYIETTGGILIEAEKKKPPVPPVEPDCYKTYHHCKYQKPDRTGYTAIEVLPFLIGELFDKRALDYIHAVRPSSIRVTDGFLTCDAQRWRVTVYIDENNIITKIEQEVEVGLRTADNGHSLDNKLPRGNIKEMER